MSGTSRLFSLLLLLPAFISFAAPPESTIYYNTIFEHEEYRAHFPPFTLARLPNIKSFASARKYVEQHPEVKALLQHNKAYFLLEAHSSHTQDFGKTWSDWEFAFSKLIINERVMAQEVFFGVDPMTGTVKRLVRPATYLPFEPNSGN